MIGTSDQSFWLAKACKILLLLQQEDSAYSGLLLDLLVQETRQFDRGGAVLIQREEIGAKAHRELQPGRRLLQRCDHIFHENDLHPKEDLRQTSLIRRLLL